MSARERTSGLSGARGFALVLGTLLLAGLALGLLQDRPAYVEHVMAPELPAPREQAADGRNWRPSSFGEPVYGGSEDSGVLQRALAIRGGREDDLYVLDSYGEGVKRLTSAGSELIAHFARPLEIDTHVHPPLDLAVAADGRVWVLYADTPVVHVFTPGGELVRQIDLDLSPQRIVPLPDGRFVLLRLDGASHLFQLRDRDGRVLRDFGRMIAAEEQPPLLLDGNIAVAADGAIVYAPLYLDLLASYTAEGELRFLVDTVDAEPGPLPKIVAHPAGWRKVKPGTPWQSLGVQAEGELFYVFSERDSGLEDRRILDVYRSADGSYVESYRLPNRPQAVLLDDAWLYTVRQRELIAWPRFVR